MLGYNLGTNILKKKEFASMFNQSIFILMFNQKKRICLDV